MRRRLAVVLVAALPACGSLYDVDSSGSWLPGFAHRKAIETRPVATTALSDFPIAIVEASDDALALHARADGTDLVVTASDGVTVLDRELVAYSAASGALELWVRMPVLDTTPSALFLYYGGNSVTLDPSAVWPTSVFGGVWHLSDRGAATHDSTSNADDLSVPSGSGTVFTAPASIDGITGGARLYNGSSDALTIDDASGTTVLDVGSHSFSYSMWLQIAADAPDRGDPLWKGGTSDGEIGFSVTRYEDMWFAKLGDGTNYISPKFGSAAELADRWVHVAAVLNRDDATLTTYLDGEQVDQSSTSMIGALSSTTAFSIGRPDYDLARFVGGADETRLYVVDRSADWIATEYASLADPRFLSFGSEQDAPE